MPSPIRSTGLMVFATLLLLPFSGCSSGGGSQGGTAQDDTGFVLWDMLVEVDGTFFEDLEGLSDLEIGDANVDTYVPPQPGKIGWPCQENSECDDRLCIESPQGKVCTERCVDECPSGWSCKTLTIGSDIMAYCVPLFLYLCDPCSQNSDCNSEFSGGEAICMDFGKDGRFCGGDCSASRTCPSGYECKEVKDQQGDTKLQCFPVSGVCECSARAIKLGLSTQCFETNQFGTCYGERRCTVQGLSSCNAQTPKEEICNGLDDDCNGLTDEVQGKVPCEKKNEFGTCKGFGVCVGGVITECDAPDPKPETCNGIDDDCNGETDDAVCYDGNPCTKDICDVGTGGCVFQPIAGPCDDGNPCTMNDTCVNGQCVGGQPKNCDDGNPCTDDFCDAGTGQCYHVNNSAPCEDGNKCTINDRCENGACKPGSYKDCSDTNPCTLNEHCDPATGQCVFNSNEGAPCDDGNVCTVGERCSGGLCLGGQDFCQAQHATCTPGPGQTICLPVSCVEVFGFPTCPCICI
jgi:hypothetical protein